MNRLSRVGMAVSLLAGVLWAGGVAEATRLSDSVAVCVNPSSGVVSRLASSAKCVGGKQVWSASQSAPLLCWNASSIKPRDKTRLVSVASASGCAAPLRSIPVNKVLLLCADGMTGVLRRPMTESCKSGNLPTWIRSASTSTTVATTTPTTEVVVPSVSLSATTIQGNTYPKAVSVTANVAGTVYFVEGDFVVKNVSDITSAPTHRWAKGTVTTANTPTSIVIDVDAVINGYYRVFVANSQGVLSAPAINILTISIARATTVAVSRATTVAVSRAAVGTERRTAFTTQPQISIRDSSGSTVTSSSAVVTATVSAGGTLVGTTTAAAVSGVATFSGLGVDGTIGTTYTITYTASGLTIATATVALTGTTCDGSFTCQVGDTGSGGGIVFYVQASGGTFTSTGSDCGTACKYLEAAPSDHSSTVTWCSNHLDPVGNNAAGIGSGMLNTTTADSTCTGSVAIQVAADYTNNSKADWYLPSKDELNELCKYAKNTGQAVGGGTLCYEERSATLRGFSDGSYWSSSEFNGSTTWAQNFYWGDQVNLLKDLARYVRPVRAFG